LNDHFYSGETVFRWSLAVLTVACISLPPRGAEAQRPVIYRVPVTGTIELGISPFIGRVLREASEAGAAAVILDVNTLGGRVDAALNIIDAVARSDVPVYAFVNPRAISAGALISVSADTVFMVSDALMGASTVVTGDADKASEKAQSVMRAQFRAIAERRGIDPAIGEAMVDEGIAIEGVIEAGKLLTLTSDEAVRVGYAIEIDDFEAMLEILNLSGAEVVSPGVNWAEQLVRFLSHPVVAPLLLSIGVLGLMIEIKTPSFGLAGAVGLVSLGAFFGSHMIVGLAGLEEVILLGVGLIALAIEVFVVPGFGVAGIVALACIGSSIFLALIGSLPTWSDVTRAGGILFVAVLITVAAVYVFVRQLPGGRRTRGIFLHTSTSKDKGYVAGTSHDDLVGMLGVALTDLHPSGTAKIAGKRIDVVSDVGFVAEGTSVRIIRSESYRHVVEPVSDEPTD
jgi:membrane-bound serine protease (ClpP class)